MKIKYEDLYTKIKKELDYFEKIEPGDLDDGTEQEVSKYFDDEGQVPLNNEKVIKIYEKYYFITYIPERDKYILKKKMST